MASGCRLIGVLAPRGGDSSYGDGMVGTGDDRRRRHVLPSGPAGESVAGELRPSGRAQYSRGPETRWAAGLDGTVGRGAVLVTEWMPWAATGALDVELALAATRPGL